MAEEKPGAEKSRLFQANAPVFFGSVILVLAALVFSVRDPANAANIFASVQSWIIHEMGWFYVASVATFLIFSVGVAASSMGAIKLGPDDSEPDFSTASWFAMLFSAGMGIGIMFYGVAEPVLHFASPPVGEGETLDAARNAMQLAFFHWGLHAWAIYAVMGMALAYFSFRHGLPLTVRSALYPLIGERIHGWIGHLVDIFAVFGTMFGVATSLGLGVMQVNAGLNYLFDIEMALGVQLALIAGITLLATASVASGINAGIRRLSELNLGLALLLMLFVLFVGPTVFLLQAAMQNTGGYLSDIIGKTFTLYAYQPNEWIGNWTLFYWGWWISWSPFVGMFIARISRGRTIRQFVVGVLLVPSGFTFLWFTVFGNTALAMQLDGSAEMVGAVQADVAVALFQFLEHLPLAGISMSLATLLVVTFFVTSSDSGSLVIDIITSGGKAEPPVWQRVFWALMEGVVAAVLLLAGGLAALQTGAIASGFPLAAILLIVCYGLFTALRRETQRQKSLQFGIPIVASHPPLAWKQRLGTLLHQPTRERASAFMRDVVGPALNEVAVEIRHRGLEVDVTATERKTQLSVGHGASDDFLYGVALRSVPVPSFAITALEGEREGPDHTWRAEVALREGGQRYDILGYTKEQVIADLLGQYERHMHYLNLHRAG
ncbi:choline/carnitine/betaine transporter [Parvibaculum lavamentivorans DS-1]|uniref:Choline/carnitine/betaine transporter n=1 Tax=Parvibaculum lavamentivorans (strain DS-1 / DSM 13023 / NCIMB 13966) TaxID=402881 RepID=A7HQ61_PARL1|nr:choline BCCT transporter BetT [Parvibaculum lavamentivorans]ABS62044.1 choline/carnitine/betaine transporter [Parvibaculum lavamentivorans DS-1]